MIKSTPCDGKWRFFIFRLLYIRHDITLLSEIMSERKEHLRQWKIAWKMNRFKRTALVSLAILFITAFSAPSFFNYIEKRIGIQLHDPLLAIIPAYDVSIPIFTILWLIFFLALVRSCQSPYFFLLFIVGYAILSLSRLLAITLVPLDAPTALIELADPLTNIFYGNHFISKDLFYSGHTGTLVLIGFCLTKPVEKIVAFTAAATVAVLLLIQHVHYTIDILVAPLFSWAIYLVAKKNVSPIFNQKASPN